MSPNVFGRKQLLSTPQRRKQISGNPTINEIASSPASLSLIGDLANTTDYANCKFENESSSAANASDGRSSPAIISCVVYVGNIPADSKSEDICRFFIGRMNKAFHGVTPPEIIRLGMRRQDSATNTTNGVCDTANPPRMAACVEFQDPKVALRATQLKNRRWYAKREFDNDPVDDGQNDDSEGTEDGNEDENPSGKTRRQSTPLLEISIWDPAKYDVRDFTFVNENDINGWRVNYGSLFPSEEEREDDEWDDAKLAAKSSPSQSPKFVPSITEARQCGFLICSNPSKTPKCDHLFTLEPQLLEGSSCYGEVKKARMCHGYTFRGKVCRNHKKACGAKDKRAMLCSPECTFAHIDSFDQLKDPHDILALLYYIENNDDVEFVKGTGCTAQEYLSQQFSAKPKAEERVSRSESTLPNQEIDSSPQSSEETIRALHIDLSEVQQELKTTQQKLQQSESARQSVPNKQLQNENDTKIRSLQDEIARLRINGFQDNPADRDETPNVTTELLQLEVVNLKEELEQSRADYQKLILQRQRSSGNLTNDTHPHSMDTSWKGIQPFDNFLERSIPTLMQMTDGNLDELPLTMPNLPPGLPLPPKPVLADIPMDQRSSPHSPYKVILDSNPIQPLGMKASTSTTDEDSLRSEISYLVSSYGNQVSVMNQNGASTSVTRFLKLPMPLYKGRDIDVALVLTIPKDYPWNGIVAVHSDPRLSYHFGADSQYRKIVSESISGLLNVCRWEAQACQGKQLVLVSIMKSAERWIQKDWEEVKNKNWAIDADSQEDSGSLLLVDSL